MSQSVIEQKIQDVWQETTNLFTTKLRSGEFPFCGRGAAHLAPMDAVTGRPFRGGNALNLSLRGYDDPRWLTFRQARDLGCHVRKGERATRIVQWNTKASPSQAFYANVFNASQIDGIPPLPEFPQEKPLQRASELCRASKATFNMSDNNTCVRFYPERDVISMPTRSQYTSDAQCLGDALRGLAVRASYALGNSEDLKAGVGTKARAREDLREEIAVSLVAETLGLPYMPGLSETRVRGWINLLKEDQYELYRVSADAEKLASHLLSYDQKLELTEKQRHMLVLEQDKVSDNEFVAETSDATQKSQTDIDQHETDENNRDVAGQSSEEHMKVDNLSQSVYTNDKENNISSSDENRREYITVPFEEKEEAKRLGAHWDTDRRSWYITSDADASAFAKWRGKKPEHVKLSPEEEFAGIMRAVGCVLSEPPVMDGKPHRIETEGDHNGKQSGFYVGFLDGRPNGYVCNNRTGESKKWICRGSLNLSPSDRAGFERKCAERRRENARELKIQQEKTAERVAADFRQLPYLRVKTGYLERKGIGLHRDVFAAFDGTAMVVPLQDASGKIWNRQVIRDDGQKRFAKGSRKEGCFHIIDGGGIQRLHSADCVLICEGYATAASLAECTGKVVVAALDSGNLPKVARELRRSMPEQAFVICGDDDRALCERSGKNPGREHAEEAARDIDCPCVFPVFENPEENPKLTDFNDMMLACGRKELHIYLQEPILAAVAAKTEKQNTRENERIHTCGQSEKRGLHR